ncbi:hypothetical protein AJ87_47915 [Rhizobium yanglingense]|nr:hypothetical protein AJ87_47915 [Rhizobium yanglingense]
MPGSLDDDRYLDSWIRIDSDGKITVFTGKVELGQGIGTALIQVAAEELEVDPSDIALVTADTGRTPDEGFTAGSQSMQNSGTAIRNAAAQVRGLLIAEAARRFNLPPDQLRAKKKSVSGPDGRSTTYGELVSGQFLHVEAQPQSKLKQPDALSIIGRDVQRIDIPGKVTGAAAYVQDLRLEGMVHARVIRPPSYGATLKDIDATAAAAMAGSSRSSATAVSLPSWRRKNGRRSRPCAPLKKRRSGTNLQRFRNRPILPLLSQLWKRMSAQWPNPAIRAFRTARSTRQPSRGPTRCTVRSVLPVRSRSEGRRQP